MQCRCCNRDANVHIADFCVPEDDVEMFCPKHTLSALVMGVPVSEKRAMFFSTDSRGGIWTFVAPAEGAYGIHLNADPYDGDEVQCVQLEFDVERRR